MANKCIDIYTVQKRDIIYINYYFLIYVFNYAKDIYEL